MAACVNKKRESLRALYAPVILIGVALPGSAAKILRGEDEATRLEPLNSANPSPPALTHIDPVSLPSGITPDSFSHFEYLSRPTATTMTVSLIPVHDLDAYVEYGTASGKYSQRTDIHHNHPAKESLEIVLAGLTASTRYFYRVRARRTGYINFAALTEHSFTTPRKEGDDFTFAIGADSHVVKLSLCGNPCRDRFEIAASMLPAVRAESPDFFIDLGDTAMTHITINGDIARSQEEADYRYALARTHLETLSAVMPVFFVLGNHEAEAGFEGARHWHWLRDISTNARLRYIPNPTNGISGLENYYAFEWGDALFIVLDVMRYTNEDGAPPNLPNQWTLGEEQLAWFSETIANSTKRWNFVFAHHLAGGAYMPGAPYAGYGSGGAQFSDVGEQAVIQNLMEEHNGHFFYGHNHLFAHGVSEGVNYIATSSYGALLAGYVQYLFQDENPIVEHGYTRVDVGTNAFTFRFMNARGETLYTHTVYASDP